MLIRKTGLILLSGLVAAIVFLGAGCSDESKVASQFNTKEDAQERADYLKRAIREEKQIVEKFELSFPEVGSEKKREELELKFNGLKKSNLVRGFDLEYGIVRVNYDQWAPMGENEKKAIVGLLSEYRYSKVNAQFLSVKRAEGPGEIAKAGINGYEVFR